MTNRIIALTSERGRSGKDTLCVLLGSAGFKVSRVAFGDVLKKQCALEIGGDDFYELEKTMHTNAKDESTIRLSIENIPESDYELWLMSVYPPSEWALPRSPRWHLQQYGTGYRRNARGEPDVWLKEGLKVVEAAPEGSLVVVTDMRQANEYHKLKALGAITIRLTRNWVIPAVDSIPFHATDIELREFPMDFTIENRWGEFDSMMEQLKEGDFQCLK